MRSATPLLLSLRPCFADLVFAGLKKAELRRRFAKGAENRNVYIYVTSPEQQLRGGFRVENVWTGTPEEVWSEVSKLAGIDKTDFDAYYQGSTVAHALKIANVWEYANPMDLEKLRTRFENFVVPQSWRYVRPEEYRSFNRMHKKAATPAVSIALMP